MFLASLAVLLAITLSFTFMRPPEYRTVARVDITPGAASAIMPASDGSAKPFLTEVQILTSRPVLEDVARRLDRAGYSLDEFGPDPVAGMQAHLDVHPVPNTNVVELVATGLHAEILSALVNSIIDVYRTRLNDAYRAASSDAMATVTSEVEKLDATVNRKRAAVEQFRTRYNIVSLERDENQVLARVRGQNTALNAASDRLSAAEGKLRDATEAASAGKVVVRAADRPMIAGIEQQIQQIKEEFNELNRVYTPDYLAKDPKVKLMRERLAEFEKRLAAEQEKSKRLALVEAQDELASARAAKKNLEQSVAGDRQEVAQFTTRFNEYKSMQQELAQLEGAYRDAVQRRAQLEASERARTPALKVLEAAPIPQEPWRPDYWRDAGISAIASIIVALIIMWMVELFNRTDPQPAVVLTQRINALPPHPGLAALGGVTAQPALGMQAAPQALGMPSQALLPQPTALGRELSDAEVRAVISAADAATRVVVLLLMSGMSTDEILALRWSDIDVEHGAIRVSGASTRELGVDASVVEALSALPRSAGSERVMELEGAPATSESLDAGVLCAAHDAGLEQPADITTATLRHTYIAYLVRQGIRFSELPQIVGKLPRDVLGAYSALAGSGSRVASSNVETVYPAIRHGIHGRSESPTGARA